MLVREDRSVELLTNIAYQGSANYYLKGKIMISFTWNLLFMTHFSRCVVLTYDVRIHHIHFTIQ